MAEEPRMTVADVAANVLAGEHGDFVREAVAIVARELMEAEVSAEIGAGRGEVSAGRVTHRNGYRPREWAACLIAIAIFALGVAGLFVLPH